MLDLYLFGARRNYLKDIGDFVSPDRELVCSHSRGIDVVGSAYLVS